ncbi:MAG: hypothetical protein PHG03_01645 [Bacilli bacterium]|nr:hypothetical protein [Bacilli bacterium]MDD4795248.1 hypothetical protein [Bacilli bacterium]
MKIKGFKISRRKAIIYLTYAVIVMLGIVLTSTFSDFTSRSEGEAANIKVAGMNYNVKINGIDTKIITAPGNKDTIANVIIISQNTVDSKYELIYKVCSDSSCTAYIAKPEDLYIEYSSKTTDEVSGAITSLGAKQIRIAVINTSSTTYYVELDINAGYIHNTLALKNQIASEYNEEDVTIAAIIDGDLSTTFPTTKEYIATVECETNKGKSNASGTATRNGTKWVVDIIGTDSGKTVCNVYFNEPTLRDKILSQGGGATVIEAKGTPDFSVINVPSGLYASADEYGTSYYYRGVKTELDNNLIWGGFQWKLVRINGDGSIRLIYNGTAAQFDTNGTVNDIGLDTQIEETHAWNETNRDDAKYIGYMYGGANGSASTSRHGSIPTAATYNQTNTNMKTILDNWYKINIFDKGLGSQVADNLFCNDRQLQSEVGGGSTGTGIGTSVTYYAAYYRLYKLSTKSPTLKCGLQNDQFTISVDGEVGNGALTYPVGLLTADEASMAGLVYGIANSTNYLYTNQHWWLFSPFIMFSYGNANGWNVLSSGDLYASIVNNTYGARLSVSLISSTRVTGTSSANDPFIVLAVE